MKKNHQYTETFKYIHEFLTDFKKGKNKVKEIPDDLKVFQLTLLAQLIIEGNFDSVKIFDIMSDKDYDWAIEILWEEKNKNYERLAHIVNTLLDK